MATRNAEPHRRLRLTGPGDTSVAVDLGDWLEVHRGVAHDPVFTLRLLGEPHANLVASSDVVTHLTAPLTEREVVVVVLEQQVVRHAPMQLLGWMLKETGREVGLRAPAGALDLIE